MARGRAFGISKQEVDLLRRLQEEVDFSPPTLGGGDVAGAAALATKRFATPEEVTSYFLDEGHPHIEVDGRTFRLQREDETDNLSPDEIEFAANERFLWDADQLAPACDSTPSVVDHRPYQTAIRDQQDRGTCVCFASLACLEAIFQRQDTTLDLSEQYANWSFMKFEGRDQCNDGMKTTDAASYLSQRGVCVEPMWQYEDMATVKTHCPAQPSSATQKQARYGVGKYVLIDNPGANGPSIANPAYLECVLSKGYDIVFGTHVAWGQPDANGVYDVIRDPYGNPLRSRGGHAMLLVGYDRKGPLPYFIFKNSWGNTGVGGYYYFSYDYVSRYAKYGYIVLAARDDMA